MSDPAASIPSNDPPRQAVTSTRESKRSRRKRLAVKLAAFSAGILSIGAQTVETTGLLNPSAPPATEGAERFLEAYRQFTFTQPRVSLLETWNAGSGFSVISRPPRLALPPPASAAAQSKWMPATVPINTDPPPTTGTPPSFLPLDQVAGNSVVYGEVSDAKSLNPIAGAIVDVIGTGRVAETDAQGRFRIEGLPAGNYTVEAAALNYSTQTVSVSTTSTIPIEIRIGLTAKPVEGASEEYMLEEESIVGEFQGDSQGALNLTLATASPNISAGLNKDDLSRTGASDAGSAVAKISGANIVGGRYAVVRGLGDRYSNTLFNGAIIPSADPSKKAVQLDLFPNDLLESVAITKLFLPELPAEFAGGTVQIQTLRLPDEPIAKLTFGTKWFALRPEDGFMGDPTTTTSFDKIESPKLPPGFDKPNGFNGSVLDSVALHTSAPMRPSQVDDEQAQTLSMVLGNTFRLHEGIKLGAVFALTRDTENTYEDNSLGRGFRFDNPSTPGAADPFLDNYRRSEVFSRELTFGLMSGLSLELGERHTIGFTYFFNEAFSDSYVKTTDSRSTSLGPIFTANPYGERDPATGDIVRVFAQPVGAADFFEPLQRSLDVTQLNGEHVLYGKKGRGGKLSWMMSDATATEERPQSRTYSYTQLDFADSKNILPVIFDPSQFRPDYPAYTGAGDPILQNGFPEVRIFRESLKTTDQGENQRADVSLPYYFGDDSDDHVGLRLGYNASDRKREVRGRFFTYDFNRINDELMIENSLGVYQGTYGNLFHQLFNSGFFPNDPTRPIFGGSGITINDFSGNGFTIRNIDAATSVESIYVGTDLALDGWTLSGGARLESESRSYQILPGLNPSLIANLAPVVVEEDSILPGLVLTKTMGQDDKILLTAGWSQTVARPTFYEFAPAFVVDQATGDVTRGNPNLTNSLINNVDLRCDLKPEKNTTVGVGLFSKSIENPIVDAFDPVLNAQSWVNGNRGTINGIEFETNKLFADRYRLGGNYTFISSDLEYTLQGQKLNTGFTGQPEHIVNLFAGYEDKEENISANFVYNFTGAFMNAAPASVNAPAIMEDSFTSLDFILQKTFTTRNCDIKVTLGARNLLDSVRSQYLDGTGLTFREFKPGRTYSLSLGVAF